MRAPGCGTQHVPASDRMSCYAGQMDTAVANIEPETDAASAGTRIIQDSATGEVKGTECRVSNKSIGNGLHCSLAMAPARHFTLPLPPPLQVRAHHTALGAALDEATQKVKAFIPGTRAYKNEHSGPAHEKN